METDISKLLVEVSVKTHSPKHSCYTGLFCLDLLNHVDQMLILGGIDVISFLRSGSFCQVGDIWSCDITRAQ